MPTGVYIHTEEHNRNIGLSLKDRKNPAVSKTLKRKYKSGELKHWAKGLTAKVDKRIEKMAKTKKRKFESGESVVWNKDITKETDERLKKLSIKQRNARLEFFERNPVKAHEICIKGGFATIEKFRKGQPYYFLGAPFDSNEEREVAIWLFFNTNFIPEEKVNCHVRVDGVEFDFLILNFLFIEYHPWDKTGKSLKQYYDERRKILDKNDCKENELIVIEDLKELPTKIPTFQGVDYEKKKSAF